MTYNAVHSGELDVGRVMQRTFGVVGRNIPTLFVLGILFVGAPDALLPTRAPDPPQGRSAVAPAGPPTINWPLCFGSFLLLFCKEHRPLQHGGGSRGGGRRRGQTGFDHRWSSATIFRFLLPGLAAGVLVLNGGAASSPIMLLIIPGVIFLLTYRRRPAGRSSPRSASVFGSFRLQRGTDPRAARRYLRRRVPHRACITGVSQSRAWSFAVEPDCGLRSPADRRRCSPAATGRLAGVTTIGVRRPSARCVYLSVSSN